MASIRLGDLADGIASPSHMKELMRLSRSSTVVWKELPSGDHNNTVGERGYFQHIQDFLIAHVLKLDA